MTTQLQRQPRQQVPLAPFAGPEQPLSAPPPAELRHALTLELIQTRAAFDALEADWSDLYARAGSRRNIFQSFNWNWHWCNHYLHSAKHKDNKAVLAIVTARQSGKLVMLWPMVTMPGAGLNQLMWMGDPVSQYGDVLCDETVNETVLLAACWHHIKQNLPVDLVCLRKVRDDGVIAPLLKRLGSTIIARQEAVSQNLTKDKTFDIYMERFSRRARRNRRRQKDKLHKRGPISFHEYTGGEDARAIALSAIAMKRDWLKQSGLVSRAYADTRFDAFFSSIALADDRPTGCIVSVLQCADTIAAVKIGLIDNKCRYNHITVYNAAFKMYGVGAHHMQRTIQSAFDSGLETFDLLAPNTRFKTEWGDDVMPVLDYAIGLNKPGRAYVWLYLKTLHKIAKKIYGTLPSTVIKFIKSWKLFR